MTENKTGDPAKDVKRTVNKNTQKRNISGVGDSIILICFNVESSTFLRGVSLLRQGSDKAGYHSS